MASLHAKMDSLLTSTNTKMDALTTTSNETLKQFAAYMAVNDGRVATITTRIDGNDVRLTSLESRLAALEESRPAAEDMTTDRELLKQQQLKTNICFNGIPLVDGENIPQILTAIWAAIKVHVSPTDIVSSHRTKPSQRSPGLICVKFSTFEKKNEVMLAKRNTKLTLVDLNLNLQPGQRRIFANHQMTPYYSSLFYKARNAQAEGLIKASWIGNGGMNVRLADDSIKVAKSEMELTSIIAASVPTEVDSSSEEDSYGNSTVVAILSPPTASSPLATNTAVKQKKKKTPMVKLTRLKRRLGEGSPTNDVPSSSASKKGRNVSSKSNSGINNSKQSH